VPFNERPDGVGQIGRLQAAISRRTQPDEQPIGTTFDVGYPTLCKFRHESCSFNAREKKKCFRAGRHIPTDPNNYHMSYDGSCKRGWNFFCGFLDAVLALGFLWPRAWYHLECARRWMPRECSDGAPAWRVCRSPKRRRTVPDCATLARLAVTAAACLTVTLSAKAVEKPGDSVVGGRALIVAGIVGDDEHELLVSGTLKEWHAWLTGPMQFEPDAVRVLYDEFAPGEPWNGAATREAIEREVAEIKAALGPDDRLWVFLLGHANYDRRHAYLHLHGADMNESEFAKLFADVTCREQVFWLTTPAAGWMLPAFSAEGRVVISATARDNEFNETEFPHALTTAFQRSIAELDADGSGAVTLVELFERTVAEVAARFEADGRIATEHAQLDDDGDGVGSEKPRADDEKGNRDGALAAKLVLPLARPAHDDSN
jgi:hypothetical protein